MEPAPDKKKDEKPSIIKGFISKDKDKDNNNKDNNNKGNNQKEKYEYSKKFLGVEHIEKNHEQIRDMASSVLSPTNQIKNSKNENFRQAMERMGTTIPQLKAIYKNYLISFYVSIGAFIFTLLFGVHVGVSGDGVISMLACFAIALLCFANAFKFSFRCFQIKHRKLCSIKDFIDNREFIPVPLKQK